MAKKKKTMKTSNFPRDWNAVDAHFRNSAGAMKDRREERGGARNITRDYIAASIIDSEDMVITKEEKLERQAISFYKNNYALGTFDTGTSIYSGMMKALREIFDENLREGFRLESRSHQDGSRGLGCRKHLRDNPFDYDESFIDILFENDIDIFLRDIIGTTACLSHVRVINAYSYSEETFNYNMWHRDTYQYTGEGFAGNCPHATKLIFYPAFDRKQEPVLSFVPGSSQTVLPDKGSDLSQANADRIMTINNSNDQFVIFNTTMLHSTMPVREKNLRLVFTFNPEIHLYKYTNTKRCQEIWKERSV